MRSSFVNLKQRKQVSARRSLKIYILMRLQQVYCRRVAPLDKN